MIQLERVSLRTYILIVASMLVAIAVVLLAMGRVPFCECGYIKLWHGDPNSSENSQQISDWYTFSHIIHGFIFYFVLWLILPRSTTGLRLLIAITIEGGWEIFENTDMVINRYREGTISLNYFGDSVLNSISDILAMVIGFLLAIRLPVWLTVLLAVVMEAVAGYVIRDNLTLNIIMLIHPFDAIREWQAGAAAH